MKRNIIATSLTMAILTASIIRQVNACLLDKYYVVFITPYVISNIALLTMLLISLNNKPRAVNARSDIFVISIVASNLPVFVSLFHTDLTAVHVNIKLRMAASCLAMGAIPFYVTAVIHLGRKISILPVATALETNGIYAFSRHPLYSTYIYWYILQIFVLQSWIIFGISAVQIAFQVIRAKTEERILENNFPEYATYKKRVWWIGRNIFPRRTEIPLSLRT